MPQGLKGRICPPCAQKATVLFAGYSSSSSRCFSVLAKTEPIPPARMWNVRTNSPVYLCLRSFVSSRLIACITRASLLSVSEFLMMTVVFLSMVIPFNKFYRHYPPRKRHRRISRGWLQAPDILADGPRQFTVLTVFNLLYNPSFFSPEDTVEPGP